MLQIPKGSKTHSVPETYNSSLSNFNILTSNSFFSISDAMESKFFSATILLLSKYMSLVIKTDYSKFRLAAVPFPWLTYNYNTFVQRTDYGKLFCRLICYCLFTYHSIETNLKMCFYFFQIGCYYHEAA